MTEDRKALLELDAENRLLRAEVKRWREIANAATDAHVEAKKCFEQLQEAYHAVCKEDHEHESKEGNENTPAAPRTGAKAVRTPPRPAEPPSRGASGTDKAAH